MTIKTVVEIDLVKSTLPEAMAVMIEPWYQAQGIEEPKTLANCNVDLNTLSYLASIAREQIHFEGAPPLTVPDLLRNVLKSNSRKQYSVQALARLGIKVLKKTQEILIDVESSFFEKTASPAHCICTLLELPGIKLNKNIHAEKYEEVYQLLIPVEYVLSAWPLFVQRSA